MNVLEEFWYGNLDPAEYDANPGKEYKELVRLISRNEEKLPAGRVPIPISLKIILSYQFLFEAYPQRWRPLLVQSNIPLHL